MWDGAVIGQQLFGILWQAVTTLAKGWVVVVTANARIESDTLDDLACVQAVSGGVGVQLIEVGHSHGKVGVGEELDSLGFGVASEQRWNILLNGALLHQLSKCLGTFRYFADYYAAGVRYRIVLCLHVGILG